MSDACENWHNLVNAGICYACQTHEIYQVLPYSMDFKAPGQHEIRYLYETQLKLESRKIWFVHYIHFSCTNSFEILHMHDSDTVQNFKLIR